MFFFFFWKSHDLLNKTYSITSSGIVLLTEQHNYTEQNEALRHDSAQCAARYELSERLFSIRVEPFHIIHNNFSKK